jgi:hypothetical protein
VTFPHAEEIRMTPAQIAAALDAATGAAWSVRNIAPVPGVFRAIPISAVADQAATLRAGRNEAIRLGLDAVAISGGLTIALPEPEPVVEITETVEEWGPDTVVVTREFEPAPLIGEFRQDPETGVVRYWTAEEVAASPVAEGPTGWNPWAAGATVQEISPDGSSTFRAAAEGLAAAGLSPEEIAEELTEGIEEIHADDAAGTLPASLALTVAEAKGRERAILAADAAIRDAAGPDEREAAQARLNALLDRFEEEDAAALAALDH